MMSRRLRILLLAAVVALLAVGAAGCGDGGGGDGDRQPADRAAGGSESTTTGAQGDTADGGSADESEGVVVPTEAARVAGRGLDRLVDAYAPASKRVNFLVAAETLRQDAATSDAGEQIERERAGLVRIESARMDDVLEIARTRVEAVAVDTDSQQQVRSSLLEAIGARSRAMAELRAALNAIGRDMGDSVVEARIEAWEDSWDASLRAAREATTEMQRARTELGLEPAPEESFR